MELIFVRHGETEYNKRKQKMGQRIDAALDEDGLRQARSVIEKLPDDFDVIYASPLKRTMQTADIIAEHFGKQVVSDDKLKERDFGSLSGKTWEEINKETDSNMAERDDNLEYDYRPYGGESADQVKARLQKFLDEVRGKHASGRIVVVSHYGVIKFMESLFPTTEHHKLGNASVHKFEI